MLQPAWQLTQGLKQLSAHLEDSWVSQATREDVRLAEQTIQHEPGVKRQCLVISHKDDWPA